MANCGSKGVSMQNIPEGLVFGADISFFDELEKQGVQFKKDGKPCDFFKILVEAGVTSVRLRIWDTTGPCDLPRTIKMARRCLDAGFSFMLDIHYSDNWADPGKQHVPDNWGATDLQSTIEAAAEYTTKVLTAFKEADAVPSIIQIGNEITNGVLFPYGQISTADTTDFFKIINACTKAAREASPTSKLMFHIDRGSDLDGAKWFFEQANMHGADYDLIGLSYYYFFHGNDIALVANTIKEMRAIFGKEVILAETAYPWTTENSSSEYKHINDGFDMIPGYSASPTGLQEYMRKIVQIVKDSGGSAVYYWGCEGVSTPENYSGIENTTWFDYDYNYIFW